MTLTFRFAGSRTQGNLDDEGWDAVEAILATAAVVSAYTHGGSA
jgi:hypothetical protein